MTIKIVHLTTVDMSVRHLLLNQLLSLKAAGFEVAAMSAPGPDLVPVHAAGVTHFSIPFTRRMTPLSDLRALWRLWRIFHRERFTIVHTHQAKAALIGQLAARLAGVPIVVNTLHGFYFHERTPRVKRAAWIALERLQARFSDLILSQNPEDIETAVREGICPRDRIEWLGNGVDLDRFNPERISETNIRQLRSKLGLERPTRVIGFVGRLVREKGVMELFNAFHHVRRTLPDAKLLLVGPVDRDMSDVVSPDSGAAAALGNRAVFVGYRDDMPELYALMDVCVLPSHREGFPRSPMEASAMGVPCVATDIRGCRQVVRPDRNGLLVPVGDAGALGEAILRILCDDDLVQRMREQGPLLARDAFDERRVFGRVADAYQRLLRQKGLASAATEPEPVRNV